MQHQTFLRIKAAEGSDGERWITAWATTPSEDLVGDVVDPAGAVYELPVPLLAYHKHDQPVGAVTEAHVTERGIRVRAKLSRGVQLADELWTLIKDGAVNAVSIGFRALKSTPLPSGGLKYERWRWLELSLTPVPANPDATIITVGKMMAYGEARTEPDAPMPSILRSADRMAKLEGRDERERYYAMFDAALERVPAELRYLADVGRCDADSRAGTFTFLDEDAKPFATVHDCGSVTLPEDEIGKRAVPQGLNARQRAEVGEMLVELSEIISGVTKEALTPLRKRIEQLEGESND